MAECFQKPLVILALIAACLFALSAPGHGAASLVDKVLVIKHDRTLQLLSRGKVVNSYRIALGSEPMGAKQRQGDHRTPEGNYLLGSRNAHKLLQIHPHFISQSAGHGPRGGSPRLARRRRLHSRSAKRLRSRRPGSQIARLDRRLYRRHRQRNG